MSLYITSINSGSNGNCYYIGNQREAVLIDAGISCRETERRMERMGLSINRVKAIFISHEHSDHTYGTEMISRRYQLPVYISENTHRHSKLRLEEELVQPLKAYETVRIGDLEVNAFPKLHDASEPHSFTITGGGITIGVLTDIGSLCEHVIKNFSRCHAVFLETNYDEVMLAEGRYPPFLKTRIHGDHGHLSNLQALELFRVHRSPHLTHLLLSHLSRDNNDPRRVLELFQKHARGIHVSIASRDQESAVFCIDGSPAVLQENPVIKVSFPEQMKLF